MNKTLILAAAATLIAMTGSAQAQQATGKITTNATLMEACAFPAGDLVLNFPSVYTNVGEDQSVSGSMTVQCSAGVDYSVKAGRAAAKLTSGSTTRELIHADTASAMNYSIGVAGVDVPDSSETAVVLKVGAAENLGDAKTMNVMPGLSAGDIATARPG